MSSVGGSRKKYTIVKGFDKLMEDQVVTFHKDTGILGEHQGGHDFP